MAIITGGSGNDFLIGTSGADTIDGGARRDYISAGGGNDRIVGGLGNDILSTGSGRDTVVLGHAHDADRVLDFGRFDTIALGGGIEAYVVTVENGSIRIATIDEEFTADQVQGSVVLSGVTAQEWTTPVSQGGFGGALGWFSLNHAPLSANPNPAIVFEDLAIA
jgi:Ca2+-binding RTX toxin-like protein